MPDTKENILTTALRLFSRDGYEAVSVSDIAAELGMTKGALYRHYKSKRDIFDSIIERMYQIDKKRSQKYSVPDDEYNSAPSAYESTTIESIKNFTKAQFAFWTADEFASAFRKMLALEQYRNPEIAALYNSCIVGGPVAYTEDIFREMIKNGVLRDTNAKLLAAEFYAPMYLFMSMYDTSDDKAALSQMLDNHIELFFSSAKRND